MGFFDSLRKVLHRDHPAALAPNLAAAWGLAEEGGEDEAGHDASLYDRANWLKKMKRILNELPASEPQWAELMSEARRLGIRPRVGRPVPARRIPIVDPARFPTAGSPKPSIAPSTSPATSSVSPRPRPKPPSTPSSPKPNRFSADRSKGPESIRM